MDAILITGEITSLDELEDLAVYLEMLGFEM